MPSPNIIAYSDFGPIIINANDRIIGQSILKFGYWERAEIDLICTILNALLKNKSALCIYDVGANIGTHSLALAKRFESRIKIRAFEAQRPVFNMLNGTLALNGLHSVLTYNNAVSDRGGDIMTITLPDYSAVNNFGGLELIAPKVTDNQKMSHSVAEEITTLALDMFDEPVDFIKMDIEGMEDRALRGAHMLFEKCRPTAFVEILKTDREFVFDFFKSRGYRGFEVAGNLLALPQGIPIEPKGLPQHF